MILGYGIIAVPTGIVSAEYANATKKPGEPNTTGLDLNSQSCSNCLAQNHRDGAEFCYKCGHSLHHD